MENLGVSSKTIAESSKHSTARLVTKRLSIISPISSFVEKSSATAASVDDGRPWAELLPGNAVQSSTAAFALDQSWLSWYMPESLRRPCVEEEGSALRRPG